MYKCLFPIAKQKKLVKIGMCMHMCMWVYLHVYMEKRCQHRLEIVSCVYACVSVCYVPVCPPLWTYVEAIVWHGMIGSSLGHSSPCSWGRVLSPDLELADWLGWKTSRCWGWLCLCCPSSGVRVMCPPSLVCGHWRSELRSFCLQALY